MQVLLADGRVEPVGVAHGLDVGGRRAFAQHLLDGISGDEVDQQEDETHDQPDYWEGVEDALERAKRMNQWACDRNSRYPRLRILIPIGNERLRSG